MVHQRTAVTRAGILRDAAFGVGCVVLILCPAHAGAVSQSLPPAEKLREKPGETQHEFAIAAQPMSAALQVFARQTGKQIVFHAADTDRLRTLQLSGKLAERDALKRLLHGSGLDFMFVNDRTIAIGRRDAQGRFQLQSDPSTGARATTAADDDEARGQQIVVTGRLLDAELSTEAKRTAKQIVDVLTSDQASQLPDKNVAETLSRIPGVALFRNGETGDGAFISIRGLDSALSLVQFDGVNSAQVDPYSRGVPLEGIISDNVREIRVIKSLLASDEGTGVGGAVNIISRTPLRDGRNSLLVNTSVRYGDFSKKAGFDSNIIWTRVFGDRLGINLAASFRRRFTYNYEIADSGIHLSHIDGLTDASGRRLSAAQLYNKGLVTQAAFRSFLPGVFQPEQMVFEAHSYQLLEQERDTLALSGAVDWRPSATTLITLSGRYTHTRIRGVEWELGFDEDVGNFVLEKDRLVASFNDLELDYNAQLEDSDDSNATMLLRGRTEARPWTLDWQASYARGRSVNPQTDIEFSSNSRFDRGRTPPLSFQPFTFTSRYFPVPDRKLTSDAAFAAGAANLLDSTEVVGFRQYEMTQANDRYAFKADVRFDAQQRLLGGTLRHMVLGGKFERADRYNYFDYYQSSAARLNFDGSYNAAGPGDALGRPLRDYAAMMQIRETSFAAIGNPLASIGILNMPTFDKQAWRNLGKRFRDSFSASRSPMYSRDFLDAREEVLAGYAQASFDSGPFDLTGGVRIELYRGAFHTPLSFTGQLRLLTSIDERQLDLAAPGVPHDIVSTRAANTEVLPRLAANYQITPDVKLRLGAGYALARPTYGQLGRASSVTVRVDARDAAGGVLLPGVSDVSGALAAGGIRPDQVSNVVVNVRNGNPELRNMRSLNLDLSLEFYPVRGTMISLGLFHKELKNFIFLNAEGSDGTLDAGFVESLMAPDAVRLLSAMGGVKGLAGGRYNATVTISRPVNGTGARLTGAELGLNHRFSWAPGMLRHLGFFGNVTMLRSRAELVVNQMLAATDALVVLGNFKAGEKLRRTTSFYRAPNFSGNASLFFDDGRFDANVSASYQAAAFRSVGSFGVDRYTSPYSQVDFFLGYRLPVALANMKLFFEVADLADAGHKATDVQAVGRPHQLFDGASFNGREFRVGVRARF